MHVLLKPLGENWPFGQKNGFVKKRLEIVVICLHIIILYAIDIRVSHLQIFLISLLFQAGIYARHTKEQE